MAVITDQRLHVITRAVCNEMARLQAVITGGICNSPLQDGPVITCNGALVIGSLDMSTETDPPSSTVCELANRYRETNVSPVNTPSQVDDTASMTREEWDRRGARIDAAMQAARAALPTRCPSCGSGNVFPLFEPRDDWECPSCEETWREDR